MTLIVMGAEAGPVTLTMPATPTLRALTAGGFDRLPGDAVTDDLAENEAARIEAATAMPPRRALDNMLRAGHDEGFARRWLGALLDGGETDATALELVARKTHGPRIDDCAALDARRRPRSRLFRDAWRRAGDGIVVDMAAARLVFARRLVDAKARASRAATEAAELALLAGGEPDGMIEALARMDLRKLGGELMRAAEPRDLVALWPVATLGPLRD